MTLWIEEKLFRGLFGNMFQQSDYDFADYVRTVASIVAESDSQEKQLERFDRFREALDRRYAAESEHARRREATKKACARALEFLDILGVLLPTRIVNEELGDFIEDINDRAAKGQGSLKIYVRACAATFWVVANAIGYLLRTVAARKSA